MGKYPYTPARAAKRMRYNTRRYGMTATGRPYRRWQEWEIERILARDVTDRELAAELKRPERGIQIKRWRLRKELLPEALGETVR